MYVWLQFYFSINEMYYYWFLSSGYKIVLFYRMLLQVYGFKYMIYLVTMFLKKIAIWCLHLFDPLFLANLEILECYENIFLILLKAILLLKIYHTG